MDAQKLNRIFTQLGFTSTWGYIFFSIVPHAAAGKYISSGLMLVAFLALLARKQVHKPEFTWLNVSIFLVVGLALLSAALTPYAADSLNQFRKEGLPFLLGFLLLTNAPTADRNKTVVYTMLSLMLGYAVKEILAMWAGANNGFQFSIYESPDTTLPKYLDFFSADTPYYLPFFLGPLLFWPMRAWQRALLLLLALLAVVVVVVSGVRTAFIFIVISLLLALIYRFWSFKKTILLATIVLGVFGYQLKDQITNPSVARYLTIASKQTYQFGKDASVSERYAIIKGVWEVSKDRLLLGYGPGWKKLPTVAEANGHMDRWRVSAEPIDQATLKYFSQGEGRVNPHNFYMTLLFEDGVLGLFAYVSLMLATAWGALKMLFKKDSQVRNGVTVAGSLYLLVYFGGSVGGGAWLPVTMLVTVASLALYHSQTRNP
jgi:O-antigen ligase